MLNSLKLSHLAAGAIAVLVGYTSSVAIIFQAIEAVGASQAQANSWLVALGLGLTTLALSLWFRMPILTDWSTPGAANRPHRQSAADQTNAERQTRNIHSRHPSGPLTVIQTS